MDSQIELLAPVGSKDALVAAIQNGADAVYMGGTKFSARRMADNFEAIELEEAVKYAHLYGIRVYITLNILIKEKELTELRRFLDQLRDLSIDGVIVQDLGAAKIITEEYPEIPLHASTQMTIHQIEGAKAVEGIGFNRVVLARELTLDEIKEISYKTGLELEGFIHGALCVSYSGQCLMSSMLGGRSGNRGMCAQPCRMQYNLGSRHKNKQEALYHLSTKDLSTIDMLSQIIDAGVTGLKIEGRMKRPEYVAVVVREYRKALDRLLELGKEDIDEKSKNELLQIFNRGFTQGYYFGTDHSSLYSKDKPNNRGVLLGRVLKNEGKIVYMALEDELEVGDGIEFRKVDSSEGKGQTVTGLFVNDTAVLGGSKDQIVGVRTTFTIAPGTNVYRTSKTEQLKVASSSYSGIYKNRKIPIVARINLKKGHKPVLELYDHLGNLGRASTQQVVEKAIKKPISREDIIEQLTRLGDTPFIIDKWELSLEDNIFIPVSVLNKLRRLAVQELMDARINHFNQKVINKKAYLSEVCKNDTRNNVAPNKATKYMTLDRPKLIGYIDRLDIDPLTLKGLDMVYYNPVDYRFFMTELIRQIDMIKNEDIKVSLALPTITRKLDMEWLRGLPNEFWQAFDEVQAGNIGQLELLAEKGIDRCHGNYSFNIMNSIAAATLGNLGMKSIVLSPELTLSEMHDIIKNTYLPCEITVYGRIALMTTEYCSYYNNQKGCKNCYRKDEQTLTDRMGYSFPLIKKRICRCYTEIFNSLPIFVADNISGISNLKAAAWGLRLERLSQQEIKDIVSIYVCALDNGIDEAPARIKEKIVSIKALGFTRGHFFRGVD